MTLQGSVYALQERKRDTLFRLKKRTKVLAGVGAGGVVMLLLAGALLLQPPVPYEFLRGARFEGVHTYSIGTVVSHSIGPTTPPKYVETATRSYWTAQSFAELEKSAPPELAMQGWGAPVPQHDLVNPLLIFFKGTGESVQISEANTGGCYIHLLSRANALDRIQSRLWKLTHR